MSLKSITTIKNLKNKRILLRCDFDVPLKHLNTKTLKHKNTSKIVDDSRLRNSVSTIQYLLKQGAQVILIGHLGRPNGKIVKKLSLQPIAKRLEKLLSTTIELMPIKTYLDKSLINNIKTSSNKIIMLENLRFSNREPANCRRFAKQLASLADIYVNNAFANSHRRHASMSAIQSYLPAYSGLGLIQEIKNLTQVTVKPAHPLVLIIGGAKIETKLPVIQKYLTQADYILVGGAVANNFIKILGYQVGKSLIDKKYLVMAKKIFNQKIILPVDVVTNKHIKRVDSVTASESILDIGPATLNLYSSIIKTAKTIIWNGPMGKFEDKKYRQGTQKIAQQLLNSKAQIVIGGGDTDEIFKHKKITKNIFISSGGGAMLEFLSGKKLPGLKN